ncbi:MinD/ParA family ATP-binding protein [Haladaptatus salinisoli]|uniref:MinD/ParA family ATP-binding protein n=1 Tax=Haladaptatus salinisoli TaxID=2884876 RepID=UPI001D0A89CC|nr:AAA family ATPase [Haladaptatus salinisoli]
MLAIAGGKGGCGKTTTTLGLAAALGRARRSVLAADADLDMPDLHLLADVDADPNLAAVARDGAVEDAAHPPPSLSGVDFVPAPRSFGEAVDLPSALSRLGANADHVLVDCPAGAGPDAATPLRIAEHALLVTTLDPACLRDAAKTAAMARALDATVVGCVLVRTTRTPASVERLLGCPALTSVPEVVAPVLADESVARAYDRLASAVLTKHL